MTAPMDAGAGLARRVRWYHVVLVVVLLGIAAMWIYGLFFAPTTNPNRLADRAWAARNDALCAGAEQRLGALPPARSSTTPRERADVLDQANLIVAGLVDALGANTVSGSSRDQHLVGLWLADWGTYLGDRRDYATILHQGLDRPFAVTLKDGAPITERLDGFADANSMLKCETPLDV